MSQWKIAVPTYPHGAVPKGANWYEQSAEVAIHFDDLPGCCGGIVLHFLTSPYGYHLDTEEEKEDIYFRLLFRLSREKARSTTWMTWLATEVKDSMEARSYPDNWPSIYEFLRYSKKFGLRMVKMGRSWENEGSGNVMQGYIVYLPEWFDRYGNPQLMRDNATRRAARVQDMGYIALRDGQGNMQIRDRTELIPVPRDPLEQARPQPLAARARDPRLI